MSYTILPGDCRTSLAQLDAGSVQTCVTSPPYYGLRNYKTQGQEWPAMDYVPMAGLPAVHVPAWTGELGSEPSIELFTAHLVIIFREVRRVLADDGTCWLNLGDSYANDTKWGGKTSGKHASALHGTSGIGRTRHLTGLPSKSLMGIPWRVALALQADGWVLRQDIIWAKPNPMPESTRDRCTKAHEYIFLLAKQPRYYFDHRAIQEPMSEAVLSRPYLNVFNDSRPDIGGTGSQNDRRGAIRKNQARPRVNEQARKELRTDTESRHRSSIAGGQSLKAERPQLQRARELAAEHGLTEAHLDAIRACGLTDVGKNQQTQAGTGHNTAEQQRLAEEAKTALGGYYREFLLSDTRNKRSVWTVATQPYKGSHFATFPPALITPCILAGSRPGDTVLDIFSGSGTTGAVALEHGRHYIGCELNPAYIKLAGKRIGQVQGSLLSQLQTAPAA